MAIFLDVLDLPEPLGPSSATTIIVNANLSVGAFYLLMEC